MTSTFEARSYFDAALRYRDQASATTFSAEWWANEYEARQARRDFLNAEASAIRAELPQHHEYADDLEDIEMALEDLDALALFAAN